MLRGKQGPYVRGPGGGSSDQEKLLDPSSSGHDDAAPANQNGSQSRELVSHDHPANIKSSADWQHALAEQILVHSQGQPSSGDGDWMSQLKQESAQFLQEQRTSKLSERQSLYKRSIELLIDKIFGLLQNFMYEFNKVAQGTELYVAGTICGDVTEVTRYNKLREAEAQTTYFRARFSTRLYSLILRGKDESIDIYLLPVHCTMALSNIENEFSPLATVQVKITEEGMMWRLSQGNPPIDSLESLCMWLFRELIEKTKRASTEHIKPPQKVRPQ